jgi:OmcA/MtrC family decaheme c-type cytochrome
MRIPSSVFAAGRYALALGVLAGSVILMSAPKKTEFTVNDKAYYADSNTVNFVRPGLIIKIASASIASDGTITVNYNLTDPKGLPLDRLGVTTPGAISVSFAAAYVPQGATEFWSYTTRTQTSPLTKVTAIQAGADSGGTTTTVSDGVYKYVFKTKAVSKIGGAFDATAAHRIVAYGSRNLTEFDLGTNYDDDFYNFVPSGGTATSTNRDIVATGACNKCHDSLAAHGGSRRSVETCDVCHTSQTIDPDTGNSVAMDVMIHKLHAGEELPSVIAGKPYQIIGFNQSLADYSTVAYPAAGGVKSCTTCHDNSFNAAQKDNWLSRPTRQACGSCHDNVNFATGANHVNLPQVSDNMCKTCHIPQGDIQFDASIINSHVIDTMDPAAPGVNVKILKVDNGVAGKAPLVTFTIKDNAGNGLSMATMTGGANRIGLVLAGPTTDYGYTSFGSDVTTHGYVSENPVPKAQCSSDGTCTYQFTHSIPAAAKGTYSIGIEARRAYTILPGTTRQVDTEYGAKNDVMNFSVDASPVVSRRQVVAIEKCNSCHVNLSLHGENRNQIQQCVLCHNASETDIARRPVATNPADKAAPAQGVNFPYMIHRIHMGERLAEEGASYTVVGFGGSHNDFSETRYPVMNPSGSTGTVEKCYMCHVNGSEAVLPIGKNAVTNPSAPVSPVAATTSACTSCHATTSALAHSLQQTNATFGESCDVCHGGTADFNTTKVHAQ